MKKKRLRLDNQLIVFLCGISLCVLFEIIQRVASLLPMQSYTFVLSDIPR